jgi:hypothetical protein
MERDHLEDLGIDWRIIVKWIFRKWDGESGQVAVAWDKDRSQAFVDVVMNL